MDTNRLPESSDGPTIDTLLAAGEAIIWRGTPKKSAYILSKSAKMMPIALLWLAFDGFFITMLLTSNVFAELPPFMPFFLIGFFLIHLAPVWIWLYGLIRALAEHKNVEYAITDRRLIVKSGVIAPDYKFVFWNDVLSVDCSTGFFDKLLKVGDITVVANMQKAVIYDQQNPYELQSTLLKIVDESKKQAAQAFDNGGN